MWAVFFLAPFAIAYAAYCAGRGQIPRRALVLSNAGIAVIECVLAAIPYATSSIGQMVAILFLGVIAPWLAVLGFHSLMPIFRRPLATALGTPLVYVLAIFIGLGIGDSSGWIAQ